mmetsp:Transcript_13274/g.30210  ORF Transcript_13274/g.30210 Transcript_13274/m.30210 type:complete len:91 (+) Transcript_13274:61-333(+)
MYRVCCVCARPWRSRAGIVLPDDCDWNVLFLQKRECDWTMMSSSCDDSIGTEDLKRTALRTVATPSFFAKKFGTVSTAQMSQRHGRVSVG